VPRDLKDAALRVKGAVAAHGESGEPGRRAPTPAQLAEDTGMPVETVLEALEAAGAHRALSLDAPAGGGGEDETSALGDLLGHEDGDLARAEERALLGRLTSVLDEREREILRLRFAEDLTQSEIGARIGVSQMQVSRIIRASLTRLRAAARVSDEADKSAREGS
jgi:RNA polymerase sigma-B factor